MLPQSRQESDEDVERRVGIGMSEQRAGLAPLDQHRPASLVVCEQLDGAVAVPDAQRLRLLLRLAVGIDQLQHAGGSVALRPYRVARGALHVRLAQTQVPLLDAFGQELRDALEPVAVRQAGVGHR